MIIVDAFISCRTVYLIMKQIYESEVHKKRPDLLATAQSSECQRDEIQRLSLPTSS